MHLEDNFYHKCTKKVHPSEDLNNLWLISDILSNKCGFCVFSWFLTVISHIFFVRLPQHAVLRCKLWTINSFCTQKVSLYWLGVNFLWLKVFFHNSDFIIFGVYLGATVRKLAFCIYLYLGHDFLHPGIRIWIRKRKKKKNLQKRNKDVQTMKEIYEKTEEAQKILN